jgi:DNA-binding transcriptional regulator YdaS (Cro superfamily)
MSIRALERAIKLVGSQKKFAAAVRQQTGGKVSQQLVSYWVRNKTLIGPEYWIAIETITGNRVTREELRPDIFRAKPRAAAQPAAT